MTKKNLYLLAVIALAPCLPGCRCPDQGGFATIKCQPTNKDARVGSRVIFSMEGSGKDLKYQWLHDGTEIDGKNNASALTSSLVLENVTRNDAGYYYCNVRRGANGDEIPTREASLVVYSGGLFPQAGKTALSLTNMGGEPFTLYISPKTKTGGTPGCPGSFVATAKYVKGAPNCGWSTYSGVHTHTAADGNGNTGNRVQFLSCDGTLTGCATNIVTIPDSPASTDTFTIYFSTTPPAGTYPIILTGFNP